jgi:outer membrane receptor protein involved in Fe transport
MKFFITYFLSVFLAFGVFASEEKSTINGRVVDENGTGVPYASVALLAAKDSTIVTGTATDDDGRFSLSANENSYLLRITFLSYNEKWVAISLNNKTLDLGNIILSPSSDILEAVVVEAERSQMELKLDKRVFNVGKDLANLGGTASDVLDNIPSITIDSDGNVSLRGSQNVRILIDGKPSGLIGSDPANALKMIQGDMIEKVEIITNPSARYEAEGEVGIINIVLKKGERTGFNGSVSVTGGIPQNLGVGANVNYRAKHANFFANYNINNRYNPGRGYGFQTYETADTSYVFEINRRQTRGGLTQNVQAGADLYLNSKNTLTVSGLYRGGINNNFASVVYSDFNELRKLTQTVTRTEDELETKEDIEATINYSKQFKKEGHKLTVDAKWIRNIDLEKSIFNEDSDSPSVAGIDQRGSTTENEENYLFQTDYFLPLGKDRKFEAGVRSAFKTIENIFTVEQKNDNNVFVPLSGFDDIMIYTENINAAYTMYGDKIKGVAYQLGLRGELSDITTTLVKSKEVNPRDYFNLFPSAHFSKEITNNNSLQFSYSRRLSRPNIRNLLPFFTFSDSRRIFSGNPNLNPEFTHSFELGHLKYWEKGSLMSSIYYRKSNGVIERITYVEENGLVRVFPINLSSKDAYGIEFNLTKDLAPWWKITANSNFFKAIVNGQYEDQVFYANTFGWNSRFTSKMTLFKKLDTQLSFDYRAPENTTQGKQKSLYFLNIGASIDVLKGNGTLSFSAKDIFNTQQRRWVTFGEGFFAENEFQWQTRQFVLTFNYRINQKKKKEDKPNFGGEGGGDF